MAPRLGSLSSRHHDGETRRRSPCRLAATPIWRNRYVNLRILAEAETEIESARQYLTERSSRLGDRFIADLQETLDAVAERPERFSKLETLPDKLPYRRALLSIFRYAVVFEILTDEILVVAVAQTGREPNYRLHSTGQRLIA